MKKSLLSLLLFLCLISPLLAQQTGYSFKERFNIVLFSGYEMEQKNTNIHNQYGGLYIDWLPYKAQRLMFGPYMVLGLSGSSNNISKYSGNGRELEIGGLVGYYDEGALIPNYWTFSNLSLGIKSMNDRGESRLRTGTYRGEQDDLIIVFHLGFQMNKKMLGQIFPKSQLTLALDRVLDVEKEASWENKPIIPEIWPKDRLKIVAKQTIIGLPLSQVLYLGPKIIGAYERTREQNFFSLGLEISTYKIFRDDFLLINGQYRFDPKNNKNAFIWELVFNFSQLL